MEKFYYNIRYILFNNTIGDYKYNKNKQEILNNRKTLSNLDNKLRSIIFNQTGGKNLKINYLDMLEKNIFFSNYVYRPKLEFDSQILTGLGEEYIFEKIDDEYSRVKTFILFSKDKNNDSCVVISIDKELHIGTIDNLTSTGLKCSTSLISEIGKHLIKITIELLKKYARELNIHKILIKDNSYLFCKSNKTNISLTNLYLLKYGHSFYGLHGFLPSNNDGEKNKDFERKYKQNLKIIDKLIVKDSYLLYYLEKYSQKYNQDINELIKYVKDYENKKFADIFKIISSKQNFDNNCKLLSYLIPKLIKKNNLFSFFQQVFSMEI